MKIYDVGEVTEHDLPLGKHHVEGIQGGHPLIMIQAREFDDGMQLEVIINDSHWKDFSQELVLLLRATAERLETETGAS